MYDDVAELYTKLFVDELDRRDDHLAHLQQLVEACAQLGGPILDLGCGPGHATQKLQSLGVSAVGLDLSLPFIQIARQRFPNCNFSVGSMTALPFGTGTADGLVCRFSTIHTPVESLPPLLAELARVLAPGAAALICFFATNQVVAHGERYEHKVAPAFLNHPDALSDLCAAAGLAEWDRRLGDPIPDKPFVEGSLFLRKS